MNISFRPLSIVFQLLGQLLTSSFLGPQDTQDRLAQEEEARNALNQAKKKLEQELNGQKKDIEDLELTIQKGEQDKATKDHQIRNLNDEIAHQDELIGKLNKEKKQLQVNALVFDDRKMSRPDAVLPSDAFTSAVS